MIESTDEVDSRMVKMMDEMDTYILRQKIINDFSAVLFYKRYRSHHVFFKNTSRFGVYPGCGFFSFSSTARFLEKD